MRSAHYNGESDVGVVRGVPWYTNAPRGAMLRLRRSTCGGTHRIASKARESVQPNLNDNKKNHDHVLEF